MNEREANLDEMRRLIKEGDDTLEKMLARRRASDKRHARQRLLLVVCLIVFGAGAVVVSQVIENSRLAELIGSLGPEFVGAAVTFFAIDYWWAKSERQREKSYSYYFSVWRGHQDRKRVLELMESYEMEKGAGKDRVVQELEAMREKLIDFGNDLSTFEHIFEVEEE